MKNRRLKLPRTGWIEVITGCMFSGKTEELIRRLRRAQIAKQKVIVFKPKIDTRFSSNEIVSHSEQTLSSVVVNSARKIYELALDAEVIGIDEGQFFKGDLVKICNQLAELGKRVIVTGLDMDYRGVPFEPMPQLLSVAEDITKTLAICVVCGKPASRTQRNVKLKSRVYVGGKELYEARCRKCHRIPTK